MGEVWALCTHLKLFLYLSTDRCKVTKGVTAGGAVPSLPTSELMEGGTPAVKLEADSTERFCLPLGLHFLLLLHAPAIVAFCPFNVLNHFQLRTLVLALPCTWEPLS